MATATIKGAQITNFDTGILSIQNLESLKQVSLPLTGLITPSEDTIESFLKRIFQLPTVRQQLLRRLKPRLRSRKILTPNVYYNVADGMEKFFKTLGEATDDPELKKLFEESEKFFKDETELRDMLSEFLLALQQG